MTQREFDRACREATDMIAVKGYAVTMRSSYYSPVADQGEGLHAAMLELADAVDAALDLVQLAQEASRAHALAQGKLAQGRKELSHERK